MGADLRALYEDVSAPSGFAVHRVVEQRSIPPWLRVASLAGGGPGRVDHAWLALYRRLDFAPDAPIRLYLGLLDGQPVATALLCLDGRTAGIYGITTIPSARRQGIGAAITLAALRDARMEGYRVAVLESSELGHRVYLRLGFRDTCQVPGYIWQPAHS